MKRRTAKIFDYVGLILNYFRKRRVWGTSEGLDEYPYLKDIIQLWTGDWVNHMEKMNEAVGMKNRFTVDGRGEWVVRSFRSQENWKCIGYFSIGSYLWEERTQPLE